MITLRFRPDRMFTIVQFTDLHIHDDPGTSRATLDLMAQVLDAEQPDLAILTGDVIAGGSCKNPRESFRRAASPMEERCIPWAAVFGNHDDEGIHSRRELMALQQEMARCLSEPGPADVPGVGNYVLTVLSAEADVPAAYLYCLDSGSYAPEDIGGYAWIEPGQVAWYREKAGALGQTGPDPLPALAFFHIPLPEFHFVWDRGGCEGDKFETICSPVLNSGLFLQMVEVGDVLGVFVGHDHINDFEGELCGIRLCYGRAGGYGTYGKEGFPRGARLIRLREGVRGFETWLRLDDGSVVERSPHRGASRGVIRRDDIAT